MKSNERKDRYVEAVAKSLYYDVLDGTMEEGWKRYENYAKTLIAAFVNELPEIDNDEDFKKIYQNIKDWEL